MRALHLAAVAFTAVLAAFASGCNTEAYCFQCADDAVDAGPVDASTSSGSGGGNLFDASSGTGGNGGGLPDGGNCMADTLTDPLNCGFCENVCELPNAFPKCEGGFCLIETCAPGWIDQDNQAVNGCEYQCSPSNGGVEICDGLDNDCNTLIDELFDTTSDPVNCGDCGVVCAFANAEAACVLSECVIGDCLVGYNDANMSDVDGCEYPCTLTNGGVEVCDLTDNDCDNVTDEGFDTTSDPANCGGCGQDCSALYPNAQNLCVVSMCQFGPCLPGYYDLDMIEANGCEYFCLPTNPGAEQCDAEDNNCNGSTDEGALPGVGVACGLSDVGECQLGVQGCVNGAILCVGEVLPAAELCDTLDNNCSGANDEGCPVVQATDQRLDVGAGSGVGVAPSTQLRVAGQGDVLFTAYLDRRSGNADIRANISVNGGTSWLAGDLAVATGALTQVEPWVMLSPTAAYVVYAQFPNAAHRDVYVARATAPYASFMTARADKDAATADAFLVRGVVAQAGAPDQLVVVWQSLTGTGANVLTDIFVQRSLNGGVTWNAADLRVNAVMGVAETPVLATDGAGRAFIAWRDQRAGASEVYAAVYDATTGMLSANQPISAGQPSEHITLAADAGGPNVYVGWTDLRDAKKAIRVNRSVNSGAAFGADGVIVNPDSTFADASAPALAARAGRVIVAWEDTRSGLPDIRVNHSEDAGATWPMQTSRADLGDTAGVSAATRPSLAFGSGNRVFVTWEDNRDGQRDIYANHSNDMGTTFQPLDLRMDVGNAAAPSMPGLADSRSPFLLTNAAATRGVVVWIDNRTAAGVTGVNADIYASFFQ